MKNKDIGIDLGTTNVIIYEKDNGIVLSEPAVIAYEAKTNKVLAIGNKAYDMLGRAPNNIIVLKPIKDGVIADFDKTEVMINHFLKKTKSRSIFSRPRILICCPSNITQVDKNALKEVAERTGARKVFIEEAVKAAALSCKMDISASRGNMIIDIGGGKTDIAVLSLNGIVYSKTIKVAGNTFDREIIKYIKYKYQLLIGEKTSEEIKKQIGTVSSSIKQKSLNINGKDLVTGLPKTVLINSKEISKVLEENLNMIINTTKLVFEKVGPEICSDIIENGITITGGGVLLPGIDAYLKNELNIPIKLAKDPLNSVAIGAGILLERFTN